MHGNSENPGGKNSRLRAKIDFINSHDDTSTPRIPFIFADGGDHFYGNASWSIDWSRATLSPDGFSVLTRMQHDGCKEHQGLSFGIPRPGVTTRAMEDIVSCTGIAFDDDNHKNLGRGKIVTDSGPSRIVFGTANDGKDRETLSLSLLKNCGLIRATDEDIQRVLNEKKDGEPYRGVKAARTASDLLKVRQKGDDYVVEVTMDPHVRSRSIVLYENPIEGELFAELYKRRLFLEVSKCIERDIYGTSGHDQKTFMPNAIAYLPSKNHTEFFHTTCGGPELYDPIPVAERVLSEASKPKRKHYTSRAKTGAKKGGLHGLLLATLIAERFPDLRHGNRESPLKLRRCPFADEHSSNRGKADNNVYVYDADPERSGYPYVGCHHNTCDGKRTTKEFIARMIEDGDLTEEALQDPSYRIELE